MRTHRNSKPVRKKTSPSPSPSRKAKTPRDRKNVRINALGRQMTNQWEELDVRGKALAEVENLGEEARRASLYLIATLNDDEEELRSLAFRLLSALYPCLPDRASPLGSALTSVEPQVRLAAIQELCTLLPEVKTALTTHQPGWQVLKPLLRSEGSCEPRSPMHSRDLPPPSGEDSGSVKEDCLNKLNTTGQEQAVAGKWLAWNRGQTHVVGRGKTRADAEAAAAEAGEEKPVLENVEKTRRDLVDFYADGDKLFRALLAEEGGPLTETDVSAILGILPGEVEERRAGGSLLAVSVDGQTFLYPSWQFADRRTLPGLPEILEELRTHNQHPLAHLRFFLSRNLRLEGETPLSELREGRIEEVRTAARNYGEQGAA